MVPSDLAADVTSAASAIESGDFESASSSMKRMKDWLGRNEHISSTSPELSLEFLRDCLIRLLPGPSDIETVPVASNNRTTIANSTPLVTKTITIPIASLCNSDEMSARGMRRTSTSSPMGCEDGMSDSEMIRPVQKVPIYTSPIAPVQESDNSHGRSHRSGIPDFVPPFPKSEAILSPIEWLTEDMRRHEHKHNETPNTEQTRKIYQEKEEKKSQANSVAYHEFQPPKTDDPTSYFLPTARSADPGDLAKQERMARIRDLRIDAHRARFNSHLKAVRGVEQPSSIVGRDNVSEQEQAPIEYAKTKRVGVPKGPSDRHTRRGPRVVEIWKPSPLVSSESIDEQAEIKANEQFYHCARAARAAIERSVRQAERLLDGTTVQVPRKMPRKTKAGEPDVGAISAAALADANAEKVDDLDDDFSDYDVVESEVPGGSSFLAENDWLVVAKDDGF